METHPMYLLPAELWSSILHRASVQTLKNLCLSSRTCYSIVAPILFRSVSIELADHGDSDQGIDIAPPYCQAFLKLPKKAPVLHWIQAIRFCNPTLSHKYPQVEAQASGPSTASRAHQVDRHNRNDPEKYDELSKAAGDCVLRILKSIPRGSLTTIYWHIYYYPPPSLTSSNPCHLLQLHDLKSFEINSHDGLYDDYDAYDAYDDYNDYEAPSQSPRRHFHSFLSHVQLEELGWMNLATEADVIALRAFIINNESYIKKLRLEFDRKHDDYALCWSKETTRDYWTKHLENRLCKLDSLKLLWLANFTFGHNQELCQQQIKAFNVRQLTHLTLDDCKNARIFLETVVTSSTAIRLRYLQLIIDESSQFYTNSSSTTSRLAQFLLSFQGLEELYVMTCPGLPDSFGEYLPSIARHSQTLRCLVWHQRKMGYGEEILDTGDIGRKYVDDGLYISSYRDFTKIAGSNLECLGISIHPSSMLRSLDHLVAFTHLRVLHVRCSMKGRHSGTRQHVMNLLQEYKEETATALWAEQVGGDDSSSTDFTHETESPYVADVEYFSDGESCYEPIDMGYDLAKHLFDLAQTVFSQNGLTHLDILAWGDFTNRLRKGHRSLNGNVILTRDDEDVLGPGFRMIELAEVQDAAPSVDRPGDFLKACDARFSYESLFPGRTYL